MVPNYREKKISNKIPHTPDLWHKRFRLSPIFRISSYQIGISDSFVLLHMRAFYCVVY